MNIAGKAHNLWKRYDIDSDLLIPADAFSFDIGVGSTDSVLPDYSGEEVSVTINGEQVLTGVVDTTQHGISKGARTFRLNGRDKAGILLDCSAPITNVRGKTAFEAIRAIVQPLGIDKLELKAENDPLLDKIDINVGESAWRAALRCAGSAGWHLWFDPKGVLMVGGIDYSTPVVASLICKKDGKDNNFESANLSFDVSQQFSEITFLGQRHGRAQEISQTDLKWVYQNERMQRYKPKTVVVPDVENLEALQKWAKKYLSDIELEGFSLIITVPDHKMQSGALWQVGQRVHIVCEEYGIDAIFFLIGRRFMLSRTGGSQTQLRFKQDGVFTPDCFPDSSRRARKRRGRKGRERAQSSARDNSLLVADGQGNWQSSKA